MKIGDKVLVYGSLKRGQFNNNRLLDSTYLGEASLSGAVLYDLGAFPALKMTGNLHDVVHGEIFRINSEAAARSCDALEGHPDFYRRIETDTSEGRAWVYVFQDDLTMYSDRIIKDGVWR